MVGKISFSISRQFKIALTLVTMIAANLSADDWQQFRGPNCRGISRGTLALPTTFSDRENVRWSAAVGDGVGGAVITSGRVFVSGMTDAETISLFAFDVETGKRLWRRDWATGSLPSIHSINSQASSTPAADEERVYFYFSTLGLLAVDAQTGQDIWRKKLPTPFFVFKWGPGMSPVLHGDTVLFCQDDDLNPSLRAFDKRTGDLLWSDDRLDMSVNYSHPVISTIDGRSDIVVAGTGMLIGYDPDSGKRRWFAKVLLRNIKTTPVCVNGTIYVSLQSAGIANQWITAVDRDEHAGNNDNRLDKGEIQKFVGDQMIPAQFWARTFDRGDLNRDGFLEGRELDVAFLHPNNFAGADFTASGDTSAEQYIMSIQGGGSGDVTRSHLKWKHPTKHTDHIISPLVVDDRLLLLKSGGIRTVFDTAKGLPVHRPQRVGRGGDFYASPVTGDGKIYLAGENGDIIVLKNDATYRELARNNIGESIIATPAIADGCLLVRSRSRLFCLAKNAQTD
ncbi:MAG: PQQ-binding-like beta-propeller repeat protein [Pirellulaceae bacterium]|nr:PQQ-binding-like beta-propeller repeat protein [Pirellulaceae bacterium]